jgi:hypothetical protein
MPERKFTYNTIEDFYMEELYRDMGITMTTIGQMLNLLDKMNKEAEKRCIYEACTHLSHLRERLFPVEVK